MDCSLLLSPVLLTTTYTVHRQLQHALQNCSRAFCPPAVQACYASASHHRLLLWCSTRKTLLAGVQAWCACDHAQA